ncbi:hypothetical protein [Paludisphaera soli]|uniref:hypothetical protein n=1 Tax=Paludisphaera soli TaxID=2712865 RepID=UPI0013EAB7D7|nr:hypothetical protein [Paludisphaera soli]
MSRITWPVGSSKVSVSSSATSSASEPTAAAFFPTASGGFVVSGPWAAIYRLAYQQALAAREPSRFQKMMEPCWN